MEQHQEMEKGEHKPLLYRINVNVSIADVVKIV
jgi:hypothetical protein